MMRQAALSVRALTALESRLWTADLTARLAPAVQTDGATTSQDALHCRCYSTPAAFRVRCWTFIRASAMRKWGSDALDAPSHGTGCLRVSAALPAGACL